jgi:hypothetical protein
LGGPDVVLMPGFHTPAENSLRRVSRAVGGADVFLSVCGLMSSGARTLLMSRWRTGGQSAVDLTREFVQELPHTTPADAWQRAVMVVADSQLNLDAEPRIKKSAGDVPPKGHHPFLWAGYMLVDSGPVAEIGEAQLVKQPPKKEPAQDEPKKAAEGDMPKKPGGEDPKKAEGEDPKKPADAMAPAKPAEAQAPDSPAPDAAAPKPPSGRGRGKAGTKKIKAS